MALKRSRFIPILLTVSLGICLSGCEYGQSQSSGSRQQGPGAQSDEKTKVAKESESKKGTKPESTPKQESKSVQGKSEPVPKAADKTNDKLGVISSGKSREAPKGAQNGPALLVVLASPVGTPAEVPDQVKATVDQAAKDTQAKIIGAEIVGGRLKLIFDKKVSENVLKQIAAKVASNPQVKYAEPELRAMHK